MFLSEVYWYDDAFPNDFHTIEDVRRAVDHALSKWNAVERADIRWRRASTPLNRDRDDWWKHLGISVGAIAPNGERSGSYAFIQSTIMGDEWGWRILRCDIYVYPHGSPEHIDRALMHELGHCLGMHHTFSHPHDWTASRSGSNWFDPSRRDEYSRSPVWGYASIMSYQPQPSDPTPTLDDGVGASIVRPPVGRREVTGNIWGAVFVGGEPARGVHVLASRVAPETGQVGAAVGAFSDRYGIFEIDGLDPGDYTLWVLDTYEERSNTSWLPELDAIGAEPNVFDTILTTSVTVTAGERTGPLLVPVRRPEADK